MLLSSLFFDLGENPSVSPANRPFSPSSSSPQSASSSSPHSGAFAPSTVYGALPESGANGNEEENRYAGLPDPSYSGLPTQQYAGLPPFQGTAAEAAGYIDFKVKETRDEFFLSVSCVFFIVSLKFSYFLSLDREK